MKWTTLFGTLSVLAAALAFLDLLRRPFQVALIAQTLGILTATTIAGAALFRLIWLKFQKRSPHPLMSLLSFGFSFILGILVTRAAFSCYQAREVAILQRDLAPLIARLDSSDDDFLPTIPQPAPFALRICRFGSDFVVSAQAGSVDIDGMIVYYDSAQKRWAHVTEGGTGPDSMAHKERVETMSCYPPKQHSE